LKEQAKSKLASKQSTKNANVNPTVSSGIFGRAFRVHQC